MTPKHEYFERLCAFAELGELSTSELSDFRDHCRACARCRHRLLELAHLHTALIVTDAGDHRPPKSPRGLTQRFVAQAVREGIPLAEQASTRSTSLALAGAALAFVLVAGTLLGRNRLAQTSTPAEVAISAHSMSLSSVADGKNTDDIKNASRQFERKVKLRPARPAYRSEHPDLAAPSSNASNQATPGSDITALELSLTQLSSLKQRSASPRFRYSPPRESATNEPNQLIALVCIPPGPPHFRGNFALSSSGPSFSSDVDAYRPALRPEFKPDPASFQLIENVQQ